VHGYDDQTYGDAFADVYDDWYEDLGDLDATVGTLARLAGDGPVLELGVGTGRVAVPLAATGLEVHGVDTSEAMLARLRARPDGHWVHVRRADMVDGLPLGPFRLVFVAYNTLFNLRTEERQRACFAAVAARLTPDGCFAVEAFVPDPDRPAGSTIGVRRLQADRVVLTVDVHDPHEQTAEGHFVEITEAGGVRLRPWSIRYATPAQLDAMAAAAGLGLAERWADWAGTPFDERSERHISVYRPMNTSGVTAAVS
jgi:SAM-dependent methyltransferase